MKGRATKQVLFGVPIDTLTATFSRPNAPRLHEWRIRIEIVACTRQRDAIWEKLLEAASQASHDVTFWHGRIQYYGRAIITDIKMPSPVNAKRRLIVTMLGLSRPIKTGKRAAA